MDVHQGAADQNFRRPQLSPISLHDHGFAAPFGTRSPWSAGALARNARSIWRSSAARSDHQDKNVQENTFAAIAGLTPPPSRLKFITRWASRDRSVAHDRSSTELRR